jgi:flavodoxin
VARAVVVYRSHSGVTRRYGEAIAAHLESKGVTAQVVSVGECDMTSLAGADYLLLGCWTSGLFVVRQHPDEPWLAFVRDMPALAGPRPKIALFTTYKLRTGSQFPRMRAALAGKANAPELELQSRDGRVSDADRVALDRFLA